MSAEQRIEKMHEFLESLSEEQLQKLLEAELMSDETDVALIKRVNAVLAEKQGGADVRDPEEAWQRFREDCADPIMIYEDVTPASDAKKSGRRGFQWPMPMRRMVAAAAIVLVLLSGISLSANAFGVDLWDRMVTWVSETFGFVSGEDLNVQDGEVPEQLKELQAMLKAHHFGNDLLPTYLPEGYETVSVKCDYGEYYTNFFCMLTKGNSSDSIVLQYREYSKESTLNTYHKNDTPPGIYVAGGISHSIASNYGRNNAVWVNGNVECGITVTESEEELIKMINSIYGGIK